MRSISVRSFTGTTRSRKLVPLQGEEIGTLIAQSIEAGVTDRRPWYEPFEQLPAERIISAPANMEFDTVVVEMPGTRGVG